MNYNNFEDIIEDVINEIYPTKDFQIGYGKDYLDYISGKTFKGQIFCTLRAFDVVSYTEDGKADSYDFTLQIIQLESDLEQVFQANKLLETYHDLTLTIEDDVYNVRVFNDGGYFETVNGKEVFTHNLTIRV